MANYATDFTINKSMANEFIITIKQDDETLPMIIDPSDTFKMHLFHLETDVLETTLYSTESNDDGEIIIYDDANGQIKIVMSSDLTGRLKKERGPKEERYYLKPTYRIAIECDTINNGKFVAKLNRVFVD